MKKVILILSLSLAGFLQTNAQLADGSTAPDFTFTDINGTSHNLYTYLNQGKYVAVDYSATWCGPCWYYHNTLKVMDSLYEKHDTPGDKKWKVLFLEGDASTTLADVQGTGANTQGNWTANTPFPICNPSSGADLTGFKTGYQTSFYPTFFLICPNKKVYQDTLNNAAYPWPIVGTWESIVNKKCAAATGLDDVNDANPVTVYPVPDNSSTTLYFSLNKSVNYSVVINDLNGKIVFEKEYSNNNAGDQKVDINTSSLSNGVYLISVKAAERTITKKLSVQH